MTKVRATRQKEQGWDSLVGDGVLSCLYFLF